MPPPTDLPLLALLVLAGATLACTGMGRPWPSRPDLLARWTVRCGLLAALAATAAVLYAIRPGGVYQLTLWHIEPRLPITLAVDTSGSVVAIVVLAAALVVSGSTRDRRPLASAALGLAALGALGAAFAGDLLSLYIGLQLSAVGGVGLSYARQPRAASRRILWAIVADQTVGLIWLGALVLLLHQAGTLQLTAIPTADVGPGLAALLLLPALLRLSACGLLATRGRRASSRARSLDVADWVTVVAVPTSLLLLVRVEGLSGGSWPAPWFGTGLDAVAVLVAAVALLGLLTGRGSEGVLRGLLLVLVALVFAGFGQNSPDGARLGLAAGLFLELAAALLPRALAQTVRAARAGPWGLSREIGGVALGALPVALGLAVAVVGLDLAVHSGAELGAAPALAYLAGLGGLVLALVRFRPVRAAPAGWPAALWLPALGLLVAALLPGWAIVDAAGALASGAVTAPPLVSAPDPLTLLAPGLLWPGGYLLVLLVVLRLAGFGLRLAVGSAAEPSRPTPPPPLLGMPARLATLGRTGRSAPGWVTEVGGWYQLLVELADRELGERPVWLWVAAAVVTAWLFAELVLR